MASARSMLFVPGDRPDRFAGAERAGADAVILDLEDGVAPDGKAAARRHVRAWLDAGHAAVVRINPPGTPWHHDDLAAVGDRAGAVMLPKAELPDEVAALARALPPGACVIPLLETAAGLLRAGHVCAAEGVVRPALGTVDLAAELGVDDGDLDALRHARSLIVLAAAAERVAPPLDGVTTAVHDDAELARDARHAARLGFTGKLCVHPRQVAAVNAAFTPAPEEVDRARRVVAAAAGGAVVLLDGRLVDKPVVERARRLLARDARARDRGGGGEPAPPGS